jgi:hypothetical protein
MIKLLSKKPKINESGKQLFAIDVTKKGAKNYIFSKYEEIYKIIKTGNNKSIYEDNTYAEGIKLFIDYDETKEFESEEERNTKAEEMIIKITGKVDSKIEKELEIKNPRVIILISETLKKLSLHFIYVDIVFEKIKEMGYFMKDIEMIDRNVYKVGCFRMYGCNKLGKDNKLIYFKSKNYEYPGTEHKLFLDTCICNVENKTKINITIPIKEKQVNKKRKEELKQIEKVVYTLKDEEIKQVETSEKENQKVFCTLKDEEIKIILEKLDKTFLEDYNNWLKITTVLKTLNKYEIWEEWCKRSNKYNKEGNDKIWGGIEIELDENYLKIIAGIPLTYYKEYEPLTKKIKKKEIETKYLSDVIEMEELTEKCVIIQSCTGTGKTTIMGKYIKSKKKKVISIVTRKTLAQQQIKSFKECGVDLVSYKEERKDIRNDNLVFCINSLMVLSELKKEDLEDTILYLDEITSLIKDLTQNVTLKENLREIYNILRRLIKNCCQVICTDAVINDNVLSMLEIIPEKMYIKNNYKKYKGIKAFDIKNENEFMERMKKNCVEKRYFLFGCDSLNITKQMYNECVKIAGVGNCVLISSETKFTITNVNEDFKNKYVFYTPSIIFGVDFNIETKQDVFIYITGKTLLPDSIFQQTTRTRNIDCLYYYCNEREIAPKYKTLKDVYETYKNIKTDEKIINSLCKHYTDEGEVIFEENTFFKLYCYEKWVKDTYKTNLKMHYENILRENEFIIIHEGEKEKIKPEKVKEMKTEIKEKQEELINEYIEKTKNKENTNDTKYENIKERSDILRIPNNEIETYKNIIGYSQNFTGHRNLISLLQEEEYINKLSEREYENAFALCVHNSTIQKIKLIKVIEKTFNIHFTNKDFNEKECKIKMDKKMYEEIVKIFRTTKKKPETYKELLNMYVGLIKNITSVKFIVSGRTRNNNNQETIYKIDKEILLYHLKLNKYSNILRKFIQKKVLNFLNIKTKEDTLEYD